MDNMALGLAPKVTEGNAIMHDMQFIENGFPSSIANLKQRFYHLVNSLEAFVCITKKLISTTPNKAMFIIKSEKNWS